MTFRGAAVPAEPGQSVGAALVAAGILDWRSTRKAGRPRGLFCGIGVCFDCLITIDGVPDRRACLVPAADGMRLGDSAQDRSLGSPQDRSVGSPQGDESRGGGSRDASQGGGRDEDA
ncbi:(2Fe-2S)-binding protein [Nonomuraea rhodomycinica]|uniref:(2Fe-2S)-binding protein n=2 Tax=Nonomuraea rhodomycinica TaxID=1712872 RepID=A0A7Y6IMP8_9ACTN|nr:(2Fe-2S)-binding protein [Nonomuraea rhodomycinica]